MNDIARVVHSLRDRFLVWPIARGVRAKPCGSRTWQFSQSTLRRFQTRDHAVPACVKRVTGKTSRRFFSLRAELQNAAMRSPTSPVKNLKSPAMFVFQNPGCVLPSAECGYRLTGLTLPWQLVAAQEPVRYISALRRPAWLIAQRRKAQAQIERCLPQKPARKSN